MRWPLFLFSISALFLAGCQTYLPVQVTLVDGNTNQPVVNALVAPSYGYFLDPFHPDEPTEMTDDNGRATVRIKIDSKTGLMSDDPPYLGLWIDSGTRTTPAGALSDEGNLMLDAPEPSIIAQVPTAKQVRDAIKSAGGHLGKVKPIPLQLRVLNMGDWWKKYRTDAKPATNPSAG